jgi:hypothetical protein
MAVPLKDGATRPCGGVAPNFKCDQMAVFRSTPPLKVSRGDTGAVTVVSGPEPTTPKYPGWCCPLGHFEALEPPKL